MDMELNGHTLSKEILQYWHKILTKKHEKFSEIGEKLKIHMEPQKTQKVLSKNI